jgi:hypothetical protein
MAEKKYTKATVSLPDIYKGLCLRAEPNTESRILDILKPDKTVMIICNYENKKWYHIKAGNMVGYCVKEFIKKVEE